jgi:isopentenyl diphosphate isomerase/L-lactate dehydrogenase-like FMN-dependent dehydrogenase
MAGPFLKAADKSLQAVVDQITVTQKELQIAMFGIGVRNITALKNTNRLINTANRQV